MKNTVISIIACVIAVIAMVVALLPNNGKDGINGIDSKDGIDGKDGVTPTIEISEDGYWVINGEKTDVKASSEETVDENPQGLQFFKQDDGTYIVSCGDSKYLSNIVIPETYKGGKVVGIDNAAFRGCTLLTSIEIPDSVTSIGESAFRGCTSLKSVTIPDCVTSIGHWAFEGCTSLEYNEYDNAYYLGNVNNPYVVLMDAKYQQIISCVVNKSTKLIYNTGFYSSSGSWSSGSGAFSHCSSLIAIYFEGTVEQWQTILLGGGWDLYADSYIIFCTDGQITKDGTVTYN